MNTNSDSRNFCFSDAIRFLLPGILTMGILAVVGAEVQAQQPAAKPAFQAAPTHAVPAGMAAASSSTPAQPGEEEQGASAPKKPEDGIKIHGHWKFVVHDPDGKLVSTREFENALVTPGSGDSFLGGLLTGQIVAGDWAVFLCDINPLPIPTPAATGTPNCGVLVPSPTSLSGQAWCGGGLAGSYNITCATGLSIGTPNLYTSSPNGNGNVVLAGNYTAPSPITISYAITIPYLCVTNAISPAACAGTQAGTDNHLYPLVGGFTLKAIASQPLLAGQVLTVTVTFSFS